MSTYGSRALAATGVAVVVLGGGALVGISASAPSTRAACVAPGSSAVSRLGLRQAELTQILTPAGPSFVSSGSRGLVAVRESLNEALGCATEAAVRPPAAATAVVPAAAVPHPGSISPNCRIV